ncbi:MAG: hypothetical protein DLM59_04155 [Pseudonocardiales bacterium]|nr:MAG: hypothetical protein DLM59_04155 [Pseudonocardiales bacterium]
MALVVNGHPLLDPRLLRRRAVQLQVRAAAPSPTTMPLHDLDAVTAHPARDRGHGVRRLGLMFSAVNDLAAVVPGTRRERAAPPGRSLPHRPTPPGPVRKP